MVSILSGIAGAGGGFIMTPLLIILGLTPAQAVATGKFNGLAVAVGSLFGLRQLRGKVSKLPIVAIMLLSFGVGLVAPFVIKSFNSRSYRLSLGMLLLLMIPLMIYKKIGIEHRYPSRSRQALGGLLLTVSLALQGIFSGGLGSLVNIVLMGMLGLTANEANVTKRWSQLILNTTIIFGLLGAGLIVWQVVAVSIVVSLAGSAVGGHLAIKKGDVFAVNVMLVLMLISSLVLIIGAS